MKDIFKVVRLGFNRGSDLEGDLFAVFVKGHPSLIKTGESVEQLGITVFRSRADAERLTNMFNRTWDDFHSEVEP